MTLISAILFSFITRFEFIPLRSLCERNKFKAINYEKQKIEIKKGVVQIMFTPDFYPTPESVINQMIEGYDLNEKVVLEPSAGKGNIVDVLKMMGARVIACEKHPDLRKIVQTKCEMIGTDFLEMKRDAISHVDYIIMNPPFTNANTHILHAWEIAPDGCTIVALCNLETVKRSYTERSERLQRIVSENGYYEELGECFDSSERKTGVSVAMIKMKKPACEEKEFEGFFMDEDPEEQQQNSLMSYNVVRDLVNRYVAAVKLYDKQLDLGVQMNSLTSGFFTAEIGISLKIEDKPATRAEFKKAMQKSGWKFIFEKMNMQKYATRGLREDINKFVERQTKIPFTMRNIYTMLEIVIGTQSQRMDKALLEVFDKLTQHYHDNRFNVEGWKTNSHYLINEKFIINNICAVSYSGGMQMSHYGERYELLDDFQKALCYITGVNYDSIGSIWNFFNNKEVTPGKYPREYVKYLFNTWYDFGFFQMKGFKKGTMHCKFKDSEVWAKFNQHVSRLKGFPLYESVKTKHTEKQNQETAKRYQPAV
jgi:hypothetical protein